ncbi:MAG: hypothetical protein R3C25_02235 [Hyphomonadaceae bacterium]
MRIVRHTASTGHAEALVRDLRRAAAGAGVEQRVCGAHCVTPCRQCGGKSCQCACSPFCPDAPRTLTSDPVFPVEPLIAPLVYEMKRTGFFEPCWSCEGHAGTDGRITKMPAVWFYCEGMASLRLLAGALSKLRLNARWRVALTYSDTDNPEPTFALEPADAGSVTLAALQADATAIARALPEIFRAEARMLTPCG